MSISSYASDHSAASQPPSHEFSPSNPSRQSGMVQPVVQEVFATVHAAGSSLLRLFSSCTTFDSTRPDPERASLRAQAGQQQAETVWECGHLLFLIWTSHERTLQGGSTAM
eukprot:scaffold1041_cov124-Isochrysis_galbana.AAC.7